VLLCWALYAPGPASQDGADGPGFRIRGTSGTTYGPYVSAGAVRVGHVMSATYDSNSGNMPRPLISSGDDSTAAFLDRNDHAIYYCPARPNGAATMSSAGGLVSDYNYATTGAQAPMYDHQYFIIPAAEGTALPDKGGTTNNGVVVDLKVMQTALGDTDHDGGITSPETANFTGPYILWCAGPDSSHASSVPQGAGGSNYNDPKSYVTNFYP
jgi:hypothetical protein